MASRFPLPSSNISQSVYNVFQLFVYVITKLLFCLFVVNLITETDHCFHEHSLIQEHSLWVVISNVKHIICFIYVYPCIHYITIVGYFCIIYHMSSIFFLWNANIYKYIKYIYSKTCFCVLLLLLDWDIHVCMYLRACIEFH